ncbi:hypothetical protein [Tenacibaculum finnmarkense]|uniref:hypothetical protein n=1 Tax=Tenacibaculum finnmarkense TaxID=2781243 RepID=UPI001EFB026E|nr:hypothetical protein [Tenacibaculum finnmarkense]MCG8206420.1 hypothetical protein [Tenacibaculum finnmarkense genomovar finnmarkense]MCG8722464.1 hypothetical protein [Tenacibaculum finnmarkense]MCG8740788.1 hypothetical protein [Tenacibaculum finnmarkense]MCG8764152.1 hypothetical protein [Tenacibaculum finnmarkense]MCG8777054.1 hypothetical protein [Tenacibaculum finnmarkense]
MRLKISLILVLLTNITLFAQVKIGDNPSDINPTSILELESTDKVFVLTRMDNTVMQSLLLNPDPDKRPLQGALVYNTTDNCVFMYNGAAWVSLCNLATSSVEVTPAATAPANPNKGDFWINTTTNQTSLFDGTNWVLLNSTTNTGSAVEVTPAATAPANPNKGDFWINTTTNQTSLFDGTNWVLLNSTTNTGSAVEVTPAATAPANPNNGDFWINTTTNQTSLFDGTNWVLLNSTTNTGSSVKITTDPTAPANPNNGDFWVTNNETKIWDATTSTWVLLNPTTNTTSTVEITKQATAPANPNKGDFWMNTTTNQTNIYNGTAWVLLNENPKKGTGVPTNITAPNSVAGDIYVDTASGTIYAHNGIAWVTQTSTTVTANNGLNINTTSNAVELGGALTKPTTITTDATNTLTIEGLEDGNATTDKVVTVDASGVLRKVTLANIAVQQEETVLTAATLNQVEFLVTLKTEDKINVYRNGVRVGFSVNAAKTGITLESDAKCYTGDQIRIVQIY